MTNTNLSLIIGTSLSLIPVSSFAQCVATQDCETLGYTETSCNGSQGVKCPFGNKWTCFLTEQQFCDKYGFKYTCTGSGYTIGGGERCNDKYAFCICSDGYEWKNGACTPKAPDYSACTLGALFYSDDTCSYNKLNNKELLGIVVYEKTTNESGWVMTINPIATAIMWDSSSYYLTNITDQSASASCSNTDSLVSLGGRFAAANSAHNYTEGNKKWCLPSYSILKNLENASNFYKINGAISSAGGTILGDVASGYESIWSSSEYDADDAWYFQINPNGSFNMSAASKSGNGPAISVRPVFAF